MDTIYDWVSLAVFAGLIVLFLQRSTTEGRDKDVSLLYYLGAGVGCAAANYFGDQGQDVVAILVLAATIAFIIYFLKPFKRSPHS
ncbi:MAG: XrtV sorting system accessory protein [Sphingomicrobium sp.]